jgi:hypothetical protein
MTFSSCELQNIGIGERDISWKIFIEEIVKEGLVELV